MSFVFRVFNIFLCSFYFSCLIVSLCKVLDNVLLNRKKLDESFGFCVR